MKKAALAALGVAIFSAITQFSFAQQTSLRRTGIDVNAAFIKSGPGIGGEISSTIHLFPRLNLAPSFIYARIGGVGTHGGSANALQKGVSLTTEVPLFRKGSWELSATADPGYMRTVFSYRVMDEDGNLVVGSDHFEGFYLTGGAKLRFRFTRRWDSFFAVGSALHGDRTEDALGKLRFSLGVSRNFDLPSSWFRRK